jgi:2-isopropylmalate synthase
MNKVFIYDTTLRDGSQMEGISFTVADKIKIAERLDEFGVHYIEGGWPGSNPKDKEFFAHFKDKKLRHAKITAFGSTRRAGIKPSEDANLKELVASKASVLTIFGKTWDLHVTDVLRTSLTENLNMIEDSIQFLKKKGHEVFYDAEHFFDGYKANPEYALKTILAAQKGGADCIVFCDTNGGSLPEEIKKIISDVKPHLEVPIGIHTHNDAGLAVANSIAAVEAGAVHVQGTFNGIGERCGNANLVTIIAILHSKMGRKSVPDGNIKNLMDAAYFISEISNFKLPDNSPFVGHSAFSHKGGVHIDAVLKNKQAYEHVEPEMFGNHRRLLTSELAGKMPIVMKAERLGFTIDKKSAEAKELLQAMQEKEKNGYLYEAADASFELFVKRSLQKYKPFFALEGFRVNTEKRFDGKIFAEASLRVNVNGKERFSASDGDGPVDALDSALRKALVEFYPCLNEMHLSDYKVRVLNPEGGTAAKVRVLIESQDNHDSWTTVGVHENIIEASWEALTDSVEYKLLKQYKKN